MYNPDSDTITISAGPGSVLVIHSNEFNSAVTLDNLDDIVYLYRFAEEQLLTYVNFALSNTGLQDYVDAMNWFN
ncbi:MAG: hypothetical protein PHY47_23520 [Lachnospiraceae bacterium]|nr:hypothetical protein [Lachnospiraceae bacterium]